MQPGEVQKWTGGQAVGRQTTRHTASAQGGEARHLSGKDVLEGWGLGQTDTHTHHVGTHSCASQPHQTQHLVIALEPMTQPPEPLFAHLYSGGRAAWLAGYCEDRRRPRKCLKPSGPSKVKLRVHVASLGARRMVSMGRVSLTLILQ